MAIRKPESATPLVDAQDVSVSYRTAGRDLVALRGVSVSLHTGELLGLIGPNGSGKTSLIRAVTGAVQPLTGSVRICGVDARRLRQGEIARRVAVVPQAPVLPDAFTALQAVLMGRTPYLRLLQNEGPTDYEAARRAMLATDTWSLADRPLGELSGGERQRVVVARTLAQETPVLLLDEPTAHLDVGHQASVLGLMRRLCREEGKAVLAVVHDLTLAAQFCDRLVLLAGGAIVAEGEPAVVLRTEVLQRVYAGALAVFPHPTSGRPVVAPSAVEG